MAELESNLNLIPETHTAVEKLLHQCKQEISQILQDWPKNIKAADKAKAKIAADAKIAAEKQAKIAADAKIAAEKQAKIIAE